MCILGKEHLGMLGVELDELEPAHLAINTADGGTAANLGMVFLRLQAGKHETRQQCYVMDGAGHIFLSYEALEDLGAIPVGFPLAGSAEGNAAEHLTLGGSAKPPIPPERR